MFARHGFKLDGEDGYICISNTKYPEMMRAVFEILEAAFNNYKVNCVDYFSACDFRALVNYKRTYADMFIALNDAGKSIAEQLDNFASGIGIKPAKCTYINRVEFKKKGKIVFILDVADKKNLKNAQTAIRIVLKSPIL